MFFQCDEGGLEEVSGGSEAAGRAGNGIASLTYD